MNVVAIQDNGCSNSLMANLMLDDDNSRPLDASEILSAILGKELEEFRCRERDNEKKLKKQAKQAERQQELEQNLAAWNLAANAAITKGRELLETHNNYYFEHDIKSLIRQVERQEVKFCELNDSSTITSTGTSITEVTRLEDRLDKHKDKIDQHKSAHAMFLAKMKMKDDEIANQEATERDAKAALAALKAAKKTKRKKKALRKSETFPSSKLSSQRTKKRHSAAL